MISFLKLGGSLITDKDTPHTARMITIQRLAAEIREAQKAVPEQQFLIGHGSGSFGHVPARQFATRHGVHTTEEWAGFVEVWRQARQLNQIVLEEFLQAGIPAIAFPPSAIITSAGGVPISAEIEPIRSALRAGLIPLVAGDVIFDSELGGTIFSTEDVFMALSPKFQPDRVLLCGKDAGVFQDYPACTRIIPKITPATFARLDSSVSASSSIDVTGGMREKVALMLKLVERHPQTQVVIFSGQEPGNLLQVMTGAVLGTLIANE